MKVGLSFELTAFLWNCVADLIFAIGMVCLVRTIKVKHAFVLSVLLMLSIISSPIISSSFGFPYYYEQEPSLTLAIAFEIIAISFAIRKRWVVSFLIASVGAMFHIHEGMYGGGLICIMLLQIIVVKNMKFL